MLLPGIIFCYNFVLVIGIENISRNFVVEKDVQANLSIQPLEILNTPLLFSCAAECSKNKDCCSASYRDGLSCKLYKCCFPGTFSLKGGKHLRKRPYAEVSTHPKDCAELPPGSDSGVYTIYPTDNLQVDVYCDMGLENETSWTVIQRRINGSVNFNVDWEAYKTGFGDKNDEYWIGNDILNIMTKSKRYVLRFDMADFDGVAVYAEYDVFIVEDESLEYTLTIGCYHGTAGEAMYKVNGMKFSTKDRDNDFAPYNCAVSRYGGLWFEYCSFANPNGLYGPRGFWGNPPIYWKRFRDSYGLASMSMKIRPN